MATHRLRIGVSATPELMLRVVLLWVNKEQREREIEEESLCQSSGPFKTKAGPASSLFCPSSFPSVSS